MFGTMQRLELEVSRTHTFRTCMVERHSVLWAIKQGRAVLLVAVMSNMHTSMFEAVIRNSTQQARHGRLGRRWKCTGASVYAAKL